MRFAFIFAGAMPSVTGMSQQGQQVTTGTTASGMTSGGGVAGASDKVLGVCP